MELPFHERTSVVTSLAIFEALSNGHSEVDSRHLLAAMVKEGTGVVSAGFCRIGANLDEIRMLLGLKTWSYENRSGEVSYTYLEELRKGANQWAITLGDKEICPIHFLLALADTRDYSLDSVMLRFNPRQHRTEFCQELLKKYQEKKKG